MKKNVIVVAVTITLAAAAPAVMAAEVFSFDVSGIWAQLVAFLDGRGTLDPDGTDEGGFVDPYGLRAAAACDGIAIDPFGSTTRTGSCIEPNGRNTADEGGWVDPYGRRAAARRQGSAVDPNGDGGVFMDPLGRRSTSFEGSGLDPHGDLSRGFSIDPNG